MFREFKDILDLQGDPVLSSTIKDDIKRLADTYSDMEEVPDRLIKQELQKKWPHFFCGVNGPRRAQIALYMVIRRHAAKRKQMDEQSQTAQSQMDEQSQTAQSHAKQPLTPTHISSHTSAYSMKATPPKLQNKGENQTISGHASRATFTPPAGHVQEHRYSAQNSGGKAEEVVSRFLSNCVPSMGHLLPAFVNYGCVHEEFLYSMSQWPQPLITNFVRNAMAKAEVEISDMEVDVIVVEILRLFGNF